MRCRHWILLAALFFSVAAGVVGSGVADHLRTGGWYAPGAESGRVEEVLARDFGVGMPNFVVVARAPDSVDAADAREAGSRLTDRLRMTPGVSNVDSYWTTASPGLRSRDGRSALIRAHVTGDLPDLPGSQGPLRLLVGGEEQTIREITRQSEEDLRSAESTALPVTVLLLLFVFGGVVAAGAPVVVGAVAVAGTLAILRVLSSITDVSVFALNVTTALGFALAVDYSLFIVSRYQEELQAGRTVSEAVRRSLRTAGRTVLVSALTVLVSLTGLLVFPLFFLRSLAYAGMAVVALATISALVVLPAALLVVGRRINSLDVFARWRRTEPSSWWDRLARGVMRRPIAVAVPVTLVLVALALPFGSVTFALGDDRVLPTTAPAHQAMEAVRSEFPGGDRTGLTVVLPGLVAGPDRDDYVRRLGALADVRTHTGAAGTWLSLTGQGETELVRQVRAVPAPVLVLVGGRAAEVADTKQLIGERLPWAIGIVVAATLILLFLFTRSIFLPVKALLLNLLSLSVPFGAIVYVFQHGHLQWLVGDFTVTGTTNLMMPILMFCIAFGLSMDYEVLLLSRIVEEHANGRDVVDATAAGLQHTGRLFTASAALVATVLGSLVTSGLTVLKLLGFGLMLAVLVDATLVRCLLVPAIMKLAGRVNWWCPAWLRPGRQQIGLPSAREGTSCTSR